MSGVSATAAQPGIGMTSASVIGGGYPGFGQTVDVTKGLAYPSFGSKSSEPIISEPIISAPILTGYPTLGGGYPSI